jgi:hypothetical protein
VTSTAIEARGERIIVRHRRGTPQYLIPDLPGELRRLVQHLSEKRRIDDLIKREWQGVSLESIWPHLLLEIVRNASRLLNGGEDRIAAILVVLAELCSDAPPTDVWEQHRSASLRMSTLFLAGPIILFEPYETDHP